MASDVKLRVGLEAGQAAGEVANLTRTVEELHRKIAELTEAGDYKGVANSLAALNNATSARSTARRELSSEESEEKKEEKKKDGTRDEIARMAFQFAEKLVNGIIGYLDAQFASKLARANGDFTGAYVQDLQANENLGGNAVGGAVGAVGGVATAIGSAVNPGLGMGIGMIFGLLSSVATELGKNSRIGSWLGGIIDKLGLGAIGDKGERQHTQEMLAYSAQYKKALPSIDALNQNYGGNIAGKSAGENNAAGLAMYNRAIAGARGTGLDTGSFIQAMTALGASGVKSETQASNMANLNARWARMTGADLSTVQSVSGLAYRYGGERDAATTVGAALRSQGMANGQYNEMARAIESAMESGIEKGFVKSTSEIAGNMALLHKLSGGSALWQGEQGAKKMQTMGNALENTTAMESVTDMIGFRAAEAALEEKIASGKNPLGDNYLEGGEHINVHMMQERGFDGSVFKHQYKMIKDMEGGNIPAMIERLKSQSGLNYTGAVQLYKMGEKAEAEGWSEDKMQAEIEKIKSDPQYKSDSQLLRDTLNKLEGSLVNLGANFWFATEIAILNKQEGHLAKIREKLCEEEENKDIDAFNAKGEAANNSAWFENVDRMQKAYGIIMGQNAHSGSAELNTAISQKAGGLNRLIESSSSGGIDQGEYNKISDAINELVQFMHRYGLQSDAAAIADKIKSEVGLTVNVIAP